MSKNIFIACDTNKISKSSKKIIKYSNTKKLKIGYKFGLEFINSKKMEDLLYQKLKIKLFLLI